jgi:hypothetical protein
VLVIHGEGVEMDGDGQASQGQPKDRNVRQQALKYTVVDGVLYQCTVDGLLLKCMGDEEARVAMREVHEWLTMLTDCFKYTQGCEACQ